MEYGPEPKLSKSSDWDLWLFNIRIRATGLGVWDLIDPTKETKPQGLIEPKRPEGLHIDQVGLKDTSECQRDLVKLKIYRLDLEEYRTQQQNLSTMSLYIMRTVAPELLSRLAHLVSDHHPWEMMHILESRLAPAPIERVADLDVELRSLEASSIQTRRKFRLEDAKASDLLDMFDKKEMAMAAARKISTAMDDERARAALIFLSSADEEWWEEIIAKTTESTRQTTQNEVDGCRRRVRDWESLYSYQPPERPDISDRPFIYADILSELIDYAKTI